MPIKTATGTFKVNVSGKAFNAGVGNFKVKPTGLIKRGLGVQHTYVLKLAELRDLVDLMLDVATPEGYDADTEVIDAIERDLSRFPVEARPW